MPVILFIIDNSASMNQPTYLGTSYLDLAKSAVENFLKIRARDQMNARNDRYMLLTLDEPPFNIKVGWKEHMTIFTNELKNLKATGLTNINPVLKQSFDLLNLNRLSSGMDTFGMGRCPYYFEPSLIIFITDGGQLMNMSSTYEDLNLPLTNSPLGSELTAEPFRWDQRFFLISLNMCSIPYQEANINTFIPYALNSPINSMCEVTGGRSYLISSQRMLFQCLESLVAKIQAGVVINFEKYGNDPPPLKTEDTANQLMPDRLWEKCRRMILIPRNPQTKGYMMGHWPIPEDFWLNLHSANLPKRSAHPLVKFKCDPCEPMCIEEIPFDRYDLEPSPLTQYILERRQPNVAWQCFVPNSGSKPNDLGYPFGYLKANSNLMGVSLYVLPYNYPLLFQLITELFQNLKLKPTKQWTDKFDMYLKHIPPYYYSPLRRVLSKKGLQHLIAENLENCLSAQVQSYLKKVKNQAKISFDQVCAHPTINIDTISLISNNPNCIIFKRQQTESYAESKEFNNWLETLIDPMKADSIKQQFNADFTNFTLRVREQKKIKTVPFKDPAEIPREKLVETLQKMRTNFLYKCKNADEDDLHSVPIQDMGNYHEYLKNQAPPLRELEASLVRQHMFGNPFKLVSKDQKNSLFGADEIDEVYEESAENSNQFQNQKQQAQIQQQQKRPGSKRRNIKGPLSKKINYLRNLSNSSLSGSTSGSTIGDSDIEIMDDSSSVASCFSTSSTVTFSTGVEETSSFNQSSSISSEPDVANMNDFDFLQTDVEILSALDSANNNKQVSFNLIADMRQSPKLFDQQNQTRSASAISGVSSSSLSNDHTDLCSNANFCDTYMEQSYIQLKIFCIEQIKKPGDEYSRLFQLIKCSQLTVKMMTFLVKELIYEAERFKRKKLIKSLKNFGKTLDEIVNLKNNISNNNNTDNNNSNIK